MKKSKRELIKSLKAEYNKEKKLTGECLINVYIRNEDEILSQFSSSKPVISDEFAEYIAPKLTPNALKKGVHINIHCSTISKDEEEIYISAIKNYYKEHFLSQYHEGRRLNLISFVLLIFGTIVLLISIFLEYKYENPIPSAVNDILAWVLIWESADIFFFQKAKVRFDKRKCLLMMQSSITFNKDIN